MSEQCETDLVYLGRQIFEGSCPRKLHDEQMVDPNSWVQFHKNKWLSAALAEVYGFDPKKDPMQLHAHILTIERRAAERAREAVAKMFETMAEGLRKQANGMRTQFDHDYFFEKAERRMEDAETIREIPTDQLLEGPSAEGDER